MDAEVSGTLHGVLVLKGFMDRDLVLETMKRHLIHDQVLEPLLVIFFHVVLLLIVRKK